MTREERLIEIFDSFKTCADGFSERYGGRDCKLIDSYKGKNEPENLRYYFADIMFGSFGFEFKYTAHSLLSQKNSILEGLVYFEATPDSLRYPIQFFFDFLDIDFLAPLSLPFITSGEGMKAAFAHIEKAFLMLYEKLSEIGFDTEKKKEFITYYKKEMSDVFKISDEDTAIEKSEIKDENYIDGSSENKTSEDEEPDFHEFSVFHTEYCYSVLTFRFVSGGFFQMLKGNSEKTIEKFKKEKNLFSYEKRLLALLESGAQIEAINNDEITENLSEYKDSEIPKSDIRELLTFIFSWLILALPLSLPFGLYYFILCEIEKRGSVLTLGLYYNLPFCICIGLFLAIFASYLLRGIFYKLLYRNNYDRQSRIDHIQNSARGDRVVKFFFRLVVILGAVATMFFARQDIKFTDDGFTDNTKFFDLTGTYYSYTDIEKIFHRPNRVNGYGETIENDSYVIKLKNGKEIDLYETADTEDYEEKLLELCRDKNINVEK